MTEVADKRAPYTVQARLHSNSAEERLGAAETLEEAESLAETAVSSGPFAIAHIYDRESRHVHDFRRQGVIGGSEGDEGRERAG